MVPYPAKALTNLSARWPDEDLEIETLVPRAQALSLAVLRRDS
jgi:hypothetical protein